MSWLHTNWFQRRFCRRDIKSFELVFAPWEWVPSLFPTPTSIASSPAPTSPSPPLPPPSTKRSRSSEESSLRIWRWRRRRWERKRRRRRKKKSKRGGSIGFNRAFSAHDCKETRRKTSYGLWRTNTVWNFHVGVFLATYRKLKSRFKAGQSKRDCRPKDQPPPGSFPWRYAVEETRPILHEVIASTLECYDRRVNSGTKRGKQILGRSQSRAAFENWSSHDVDLWDLQDVPKTFGLSTFSKTGSSSPSVFFHVGFANYLCKDDDCWSLLQTPSKTMMALVPRRIIQNSINHTAPKEEKASKEVREHPPAQYTFFHKCYTLPKILPSSKATAK